MSDTVSTANATAAQQSTPARLAGKPRDDLFSNAKFLLVALVVIGHAWEPMRHDSPWVDTAYMTLYAFHMPAFIVISGYFSKNFTGRPDQLHRLVAGVVAPYLIFSVLYGVTRKWTSGEATLSLMEPYYLLWFLVALFLWRVTSPLWKAVRHPILIAFAISLGAIMIQLPDVLDLGRVLLYLPFFVAGMYLRREHFEALRRPWIRAGLLLAAAGVIVAAYFFGRDLNSNWIYFNEGAEQMHVPVEMAVPIKVILTVASIILVTAFFTLVPDRKIPLISAYGAATMFPFLLHGFFVKLGEHAWGWYDFAWIDTVPGALAVTAAALALTFVLCSAPVRWLTTQAVEPRLSWMFRNPATIGGRPGAATELAGRSPRSSPLTQ